MQARLPTEERQAEIVAAALHLVREISPSLVTTANIAASVGVTQGALFKHFPTKDAIWLAAMGWVTEQLLRKLQDAAASSDSPITALEAVFKAHIGFVVDHPGVPRLVFHELQRAVDSPIKQEVRKLLAAYRKLLMGLLDAAVKRGEADTQLDREAAATMFVGIVQGLVMQSMAAGKPASIKTRSGPVFALYRRSLREGP